MGVRTAERSTGRTGAHLRPRCRTKRLPRCALRARLKRGCLGFSWPARLQVADARVRLLPQSQAGDAAGGLRGLRHARVCRQKTKGRARAQTELSRKTTFVVCAGQLARRLTAKFEEESKVSGANRTRGASRESGPAGARRRHIVERPCSL